MSQILLSFTTSNPDEIQLACDFWDLNKDGYWQFTVKELMLRAGLNRNELIATVRNAASATYVGIRCSQCNDPYWLLSRSDAPRRNDLTCTTYVCRKCLHAQIEEERRREAEEEHLERLRLSSILETLKSSDQPYDYQQIAYFDAVIACSIMIQSELACETGRVGDARVLGLCPSDDLLRRLMGSLHSRGILLFGEQTKIAALSPNSKDEFSYSYFSLLVDWRFAPAADGSTFREVFRQVSNRIDERKGSEECRDAIRTLWWDLARDEIERHLRGQLRQYGLADFNVGEKFREAFDYTLQRFSVPKARYLIYRVAKNAAALSTRVDFNRGRAINTIPGALIRDCDRATADQWNINGFTLKWDTEEPQLFTFLFDRLLGTGVGGFRITTGAILEQILQEDWNPSKPISRGPDIIQ